MQLNDARKARLAEIAQNRLAFGEYQTTLEQLEKDIEASWAKRIKKHGSGGKKTLQGGVLSGNGRPAVAEVLKQKVKVRRQWMDTVGKTMLSRPVGEVTGLPSKSIFEGIGDSSSDKDEKAVEEAMDIDDADADEVDGTAV